MEDWGPGEFRKFALAEFGERYRRYRLTSSQAEEEMTRSLRRFGQVSPLMVFVEDSERAEVVDGFKRLTAARRLEGMSFLWARRIEGDERRAKGAIYSLNSVGRQTQTLEEAWLVQALVREDGLSQQEAAELLGRHKSWVCRRLALLEKLAEPLKSDLRLGLLSARMARELLRLPMGNQEEVLSAARRETLSVSETRGVVDLLLAAPSHDAATILASPREVLRQARLSMAPRWDNRLTASGNRVQRQLGHALDQLWRMEGWLVHGSRLELSASDRIGLRPSFELLAQGARNVADLTDSLLTESRVPWTK